MLRLEEAPLFARLSRVDLARLLPEIQEFTLAPGDQVAGGCPAEGFVYVILGGMVDLVGTGESATLVLNTLTEGEMFFEEVLVGCMPECVGRAVTDVKLCRIPAGRVTAMIQQDPGLMHEVLRRVLTRLNQSQRELLRTKANLQTYSEELWGVLDQDIAMSGAGLESPADLAPARPPGVGDVDLLALLRGSKGAGMVISVLSGALVYFLMWRTRSPTPVAVCSSVMAWALGSWMFDTMPDYVVAMAAISLVVAAGVAPVGVALSGFANATWFLSLAILGIGTAIARSGLLFRTALHMLRLLPATYWGQALAMALAGLLLTPVLPSPSGRVAIASPLAMELSEAMRLGDRSKGSAGLAMSVLLGFGQMYFLFLNGTGSCILLWSLLPPEARQQVTWGYWLLVAFPLGVVVFGATFLAILRLLGPRESVAVSKETVAAQIATLGPMSRLEKVTLVVVTLVLLAFITQPLHGIDPTWAAMVGLLFLAATGTVDREAIRRGIDWNFLLLYGGLIGLAAILDQTGISKMLSQWLSEAFHPLLPYPGLFLITVAAATLLLRLAMPMVAAALLMVVTLYPLAPLVGIHPFLITLAVQVASNPWLLPHQNTFYQTAVAGTEGRAFTHEQVRALAYIYAGLTVVSIPLAIPFWRWLGLVP